MSRAELDPGFEALDACHRQIQLNLNALSALLQQVESSGVDLAVRDQAREIEAFFSGTSRQHHQDEETQVFPDLLGSDKPELVAAVRTLQQDHGWIEENWLALAPMLRAIASGNDYVDQAEFQHYVGVFLALCLGHIALEKTLIYPESKAQWAKVVLARKQRIEHPVQA